MDRNEIHSTIMSTAGGVMTKEVGAVTGVLELATRPQTRGIEVAVRYAGADEWYTVEGSPLKPSKPGDPSELRELHERVVEYLTTPGISVGVNEEPTSLREFSP